MKHMYLSLIKGKFVPALLFCGCIVGCTLLLSCCIKPKTGSVTGVVILVNDSGEIAKDPVDYSGARVALYKLAVYDSTLVRLNSEYPQTGVLLSQETEFDHRSDNPVRSTITAADGSFSLTGLDAGTYNLVIMKEDWGVKYLYRIQVIEGDTAELGSIDLYPVQTLHASVIDDLVMKTGHCYHITDHVNFIGAVEIQERAMIFADPGVMIKFYGNVVTPEVTDINQAWRIIPSQEMYSPEQYDMDTDDYYNSVSFTGDSVRISNGIFRYLANSIIFNCNTSVFQNIMISDVFSGVSVTMGVASIENIVVARGVDYGINISSTSSGQSSLRNSIVMKTNEGIAWTTLGSQLIEGCYFYDNNRAIRIHTATGSISHNCFDQNSSDIYTYNVPELTQIKHNVFYYSKFLGIVPCFGANVNNNNFYRTDGQFISIWAGSLPNNSFVLKDLDATNNYWAVHNVDDYLMDADDNADHPDEPCAFHITYYPKRNSPVQDAGIQ